MSNYNTNKWSNYYNRNNIMKPTGKLYGNIGTYFTITTRDRDGNLKEAGPFVKVNDFPERITLSMFKYFLGDEEAQVWIDLFGEDILEKNLRKISPRSFLTYDFYEDKGAYGGLANILTMYRAWLYGDYTSHTCKEWKGEWSREYNGYGFDYIHRSQYRTWEKDFIEACLKDRFSYLKDFAFDAYGITRKPDEIWLNELYIHCGEKNKHHSTSLYIPLGALANNDFSVVVNRMESYFKWYYSGPDRKEQLDASLALLESPEALKLKEILENNR